MKYKENCFGNLTKLVHLDLRNCDFNGSIPSQLFHLRNLQYLDLSVNSIQGELPRDGFGNLTKLVHLDLWNNPFINGSIPSQLFHLRYLQYLDLSSISFHGTLSGEVASLQNLRVLKLDAIFYSENELPKEIWNLTKLHHLSLAVNNFFGKIPSSSIMNLKELETLDLSDNSVSMEIPIDIGNLT
ncbi:receptor-like protein 11 [Quercus lobata]|uniref:receptor-like protein 11 n=1 Tax=Quercus lobata TaxID=97700 RepID=UPI0012459A67|nr:receptor-like protein 11 [Quercus lobata]